MTNTAGFPTVSWEHSGEKVIDGIITSGEGTITVTVTLQFDPLTYQDGGEYTCVGISAIPSPNTTEISFELDVQGKPEILLFAIYIILLEIEY